MDEINNLKRDSEADGKRLDELQQLKDQLNRLENAEIKLPDLQSMVQRIDRCSYEEKRMALEALDIKVKATPESVEITGIIPVDITSTPSPIAGRNPIHHCTNMGKI